MAAIGTLAVNLIAETAAFDRRMKRSKSKVEKFSLVVAKTEARLSFLSNSARTAGRSISKMSSVTLAPLKGLVTAMAAVKASTIALGAASVNAAADYEMFRQNLRMVIASKKEADKAFKESIDFSVKTPFTPDEIIRTRAQLESVGVSGKKAVEDVASAAAGMNREISDVAAAIISMETDPIRKLGIRLNKQGDEFLFRYKDKLGQAQQITVTGFEQAQQALLNIFGKKFEGGLERMAITGVGFLSTLKGAVKDLRATFGEGYLDEYKLVIHDLIEGTKSIKTIAKEAGENFGDEMMKARAGMLAAFDVGASVAALIKDSLKYDGGIGEVILASLDFGATLIGKSIFTAFEISLPLWKTIGTILGQGVLNALYQSGLPLTNKLRGKAVEKRLVSMDMKEFRDIAESFGISVNKSNVRVPLNSNISNMDEYRAVRQESPSKGDIGKVLSSILKLPVSQQLEYAQIDTAETIARTIDETRSVFTSSIKELGTEAGEAFQKFSLQLQAASVGIKDVTIKTKEQLGSELAEMGKSAVNITADFNSNYKKHLAEGAKLIKEWNEKLNGGGKELAANMKNQFEGVAESVKKTAKETRDSMRELLSPIETSFEDAIFDCEKLSDVLSNLGRDMARVLFRQKVTEPLMIGMTNLFSKDKGSSGVQDVAASTATKGIGQTLDKFAGDVNQTSTKMTSGITDSLSGFGEGLGGLLSGLGNVFGNLLGGLGAGAGGLMSGIGSIIGGGLSMLTGGIGGMLGMLPFFANGGVFSSGRLVPLASGGVVSGPTIFPLAGGKTGMMGEAGPEAVMPLTRSSDGKLGVRAGGQGGSGEIRIINVTNPKDALKYLNTSSGDKVFVNAVSRNISTIKGMLLQ